MALPLFYPLPRYVPRLPTDRAIGLDELCAAAGVPCRASGNWVRRKVTMTAGDRPEILAEPGGWGTVQVTVPPKYASMAARYALGALAYALHDGVARESIKGQAWAAPEAPAGRPRSGQAISNRERQRRFRERQGG